MDAKEYGALLDDLVAEEDQLDAVVAPLDDAGWATATPAEGWDVRDSIAHLAATDDWAVLALSDPDEFRARLAAWIEAPEFAEGIGSGRLGKEPPPGVDILEWWRDRRAAVVSLLRRRQPSDRGPWFGPDMSASSSATARLMETWAHGRDVYEALGVAQPVTARLRHVAELGVRTRGWSYVARGLTPSEAPVRVELTAPDGTQWTWGDASAPDGVRGRALDFCLVTTQRLNPADTALEITGEHAKEWMSITQAFAGQPTDQRAPSSS